MPSPFRFCLRCRTSYEQARGSDFAKLAKLSAEGRSSAMSLITASIVRTLRTWEGDLDDRGAQAARVRRQPAGRLAAGRALQRLRRRSPSCAARCTGRWRRRPAGLTDEIVGQRVTEELGLTMADFARNPGAKYSQRDEAWRALREVTGYRLYLDLERGWRVTMPNLEQTGLLRIGYRDLPEVAADADAWQGSHVALRDDDPAHRAGDRRRAAGRAAPQPGHRRRVPQRRRVRPGPAAVRPAPAGAVVAARARAPAGRGRGLPRAGQARPAAQQRVHVRAGPVRAVPDPRVRQPADHPEDARRAGDHRRPAQHAQRSRAADRGRASGRERRPGLPAARGGDPLAGRERPVRRRGPGRGGPWPTRKARGSTRSSASCTGSVAATLAGLRAKEHTAQVPPSRAAGTRGRVQRGRAAGPVLLADHGARRGHQRAERGRAAQRAAHPGQLRAARRPGRAVRAARPGRHLLRHRQRPRPVLLPPSRPRWSAESVAPPRLDLANEDLVRSHVHAIWLAETGQDLRGSLTDVLDVGGDKPEPGAPARGTRAAQ